MLRDPPLIDILNLPRLPQKIRCYHSYHPKINHPALYPRHQGSREYLRGPGQNMCSDCFNRVFDCSIRVYRSFGAQGKMPQLPPSLRPCSSLSNILRNASLAIFISGNLPIIPELFFMLSYSNYSQNYSGIIDGSLPTAVQYNINDTILV